MGTFKMLALAGLRARRRAGGGRDRDLIYVMSTIEQPTNVSVRQDGAIEIRDYPALRVAEVTRQGDRQTACARLLRRSRPISSPRNRPGESVSMTAP